MYFGDCTVFRNFGVQITASKINEKKIRICNNAMKYKHAVNFPVGICTKN
jgi:hypothetical protein